MAVAACALSFLAAACGDGIPVEKPDDGTIEAFNGQTLETQLKPLASVRGFADQLGGGIFVREDGTAVRLRLDGTLAPLESHPGNPAPPTRVAQVHAFGPHAALAIAGNAPFVAQAGWLITPPWAQVLPSDGFVGTADPEDGTLWLAHANGLFRLKDGLLTELKSNGASLDGITALAPGPSKQGEAGLWIARNGELSVVVASGESFTVKPAELSEEDQKAARALVGLSAGRTRGQELWVLVKSTVLRRTDDGWHRYDLGATPDELIGSGRFAWLRLGGRILGFSADEGGFVEVTGTGATALVAADPTGALWYARDDGTLVEAAHLKAARLSGLDENQRVISDQLTATAVFKSDAQPQSVDFQFDDGETSTASAAPWSVGGVDAEGRLKPFSLDGLTEGKHTLTVTAHQADGTASARVVLFDFRPGSLEPLSWAKDIQPIYAARCQKCHQMGPGRDLDGFEQWQANADAIVAAVNEKRMPADGPLDPPLIVKIQRWAQTGAKP